MALASKYQGIVVTSKQEYSCMQKIICCKCFQCFQQQKVMTSDIRKQTIQRMMEAYLVKDDDQVLLDPVKLMILIYVCNDDHIPSKHIQRCKINPSTGVINYRTDLQFYIPQLCNYIVFHRSLENNYLKEAMEKMCKLNFYFGHLYYFYMKSLQKNVTKTEIQILRPVVDYNRRLVHDLGEHFKSYELTSLDLYIQNNSHQIKEYQPDQFTKNMIVQYESKKMQYGKLVRTNKVKIEDLQLKKYASMFGDHEFTSSFQSTFSFFEDLFYICQQLKSAADKKQKAIQFIKVINEQLPSTAYVPFSKNLYRICSILKIVTSEVRIFSTKERAPMCLCIETFCPAVALPKEGQDKFWTNIQTPITLKMMNFANRGSFFARNYQKTATFKKQRQTSLDLKRLGPITNIMQQQRIKQMRFNNFNLKREDFKECLPPAERFSTSVVTEMASVTPQQMKYKQQLIQNGQSRLQKISQAPQSDQNPKKSYKDIKNYNINTKKYYEQAFQNMFGQPLNQAKQRIAKNSVFGNIASWDIIYIIIKTNDDLKQEQFAMQLLHQFDYIFKLEKLPLMLTTYEVLSMGVDKGIIQMVKDSVTFDKLQRTLKTAFPSKLTLRDFFEIYYGDELTAAKQNFLKSLAAYCLVMYIIQAKDRHNGNILLHRNDFGFFLSNMPGKGIELERDCPFKLLSQHVQVLDGTNSYYFKKFREYFFLGFKAIRKHQNKVLMLVKLMYSSGGMTMPCFLKGEATITAMENRLNPPGVTNDSLLNEHCQQLVNLSIDNWASKWYDRFQYWAQGIFY